MQSVVTAVLLLLFCIALPSSHAVNLNVSPNSAPQFGGTQITVTGVNIAGNGDSTIFIDNFEMDLRFEDSTNQVRVVPSSLNVGTYDFQLFSLRGQFEAPTGFKYFASMHT